MNQQTTTTTNSPDRIRVLHQFESLFRLTKAYNANNFANRSWRSIIPNAFAAFYVTVANLTFLIFIVLIAWNLIENIGDVNELVASMPIVISLSWAVSIAVDMMWKNQIIAEAIERLQKVIDHRKFELVFLNSIRIFHFSVRSRTIFA